MGNKSEKEHQSSKSNIDLGRARKERIELFRAKRLTARQPLATQEEAVNTLVDQALDAEGIPATT